MIAALAACWRLLLGFRYELVCCEKLEPRVLFSGATGITKESPDADNLMHNLAIVDAQLPNQKLLDQSLIDSKIIRFNPKEGSAANVLQRATEAARSLGGNLQSIMLLSHGQSGEFELGAGTVSLQTLASNASAWSRLGKEIAPGGSIDLFGCDVAQGTNGQQLLDRIHTLSGAAVYGSTDITGKDGDWTLEAHSNGVAGPAALPLRSGLLRAYPADLGVVTIPLGSQASSTPDPVAGTRADLSVIANDTRGANAIVYTWSAVVKPLGSNPLFSINSSKAARNTAVTFDRAGLYTFSVTASDGLFFAISAVVVTVTPTLSRIGVSPAARSLNLNQSEAFAATAYDQFDQAIALPPLLTWSVDSGSVGSIGPLGVYSAGTTPGSATIRARSGVVDGTAIVTVTDAAPTVMIPASANPNLLSDGQVVLNVLGADDGGESNLTYTWSATSKPPGSNPSFSVNGLNQSKSCLVRFDQAGTYVFTVSISDGERSATSSVTYTLNQSLSRVSVSPAVTSLTPNATEQFSATALDQFGDRLLIQPAFSWSLGLLSAGSINATGLFAASGLGSATNIATTGLLNSGSASVTVASNAPTVEVPASAVVNPLGGASALLNVLGQGSGGESSLTYTWAATDKPAGSDPTFSVNGSNSAKVSTVHFDRSGTYQFTVTISDGSLSTTSSIIVNVNQLQSSILVSPPAPGIAPNGTEQFAATALDQFRDPLLVQPAFTWSLGLLNPGTISSNGLYTAAASAGNATVLATAGLLEFGSATVSIGGVAPSLLLPATAVPGVVDGTTAVLSVLSLGQSLLSHLTFTWAATSKPAGADPTFSPNGTGLSNLSVVTFDDAGNYTFTVTISDGTRSTISSVNVTVKQTLSNVSLSPINVILPIGSTLQFAATALDQFGRGLTNQPAFNWDLLPVSLGTIAANGLYTASDVSGGATVIATTNLLFNAIASVTVFAHLPSPVPTPTPALPLTPPTGSVPSLSPTPTAALVPAATPTPAPISVPVPSPVVPSPAPTVVPSLKPLPDPTPSPKQTAVADLSASSDRGSTLVSSHFEATGRGASTAGGGVRQSTVLPTLTQSIARSLLTTSAAITTGFLAQMMIPASFLTSLFASLPAWRWFDPVSILSSSGKSKVRRRNRFFQKGSDRRRLEDLIK